MSYIIIVKDTNVTFNSENKENIFYYKFKPLNNVIDEKDIIYHTKDYNVFISNNLNFNLTIFELEKDFDSDRNQIKGTKNIGKRKTKLNVYLRPGINVTNAVYSVYTIDITILVVSTIDINNLKLIDETVNYLQSCRLIVSIGGRRIDDGNSSSKNHNSVSSTYKSIINHLFNPIEDIYDKQIEVSKYLNTSPDINIIKSIINEKDCSICYDDYNDNKIILGCGHLFCSNCIIRHSNANIHKLYVKCPSTKCEYKLRMKEINITIPDDISKKIRLNIIRKDGFPSCKNCESPLLLSFERRNIRYCLQCSDISCDRCGKEYHSVKTCKSLDINTIENEKLGIKKCPNCSVDIQKNEGCDHMRCFRCNYGFCWSDLRRWNGYGNELTDDNIKNFQYYYDYDDSTMSRNHITEKIIKIVDLNELIENKKKMIMMKRKGLKK